MFVSNAVSSFFTRVALRGSVGRAAGECFPCLKYSLVFSSIGQVLPYSMAVELLCLQKRKARNCYILKKGRSPGLQVRVLRCFSTYRPALLLRGESRWAALGQRDLGAAEKGSDPELVCSWAYCYSFCAAV